MLLSVSLPQLLTLTTNQALFQSKQFNEALEKYTEAIQLAVRYPAISSITHTDIHVLSRSQILLSSMQIAPSRI